MNHADIFGFIGLVVVVFFSFLSVATWSDNRRRERETYYGNETVRKIAEMPGATPASVQEFVREQQAGVLRRRREGIKLGGLILVAIGIGVTMFLVAAPGPAPIHMMGAIPGMIGLAMLFYAYVVGPKVS